MDPNANLKELRSRIKSLVAQTERDDPDPDITSDDAQRIDELFTALDEWLGNGGFKPQAWGN